MLKRCTRDGRPGAAATIRPRAASGRAETAQSPVQRLHSRAGTAQRARAAGADLKEGAGRVDSQRYRRAIEAAGAGRRADGDGM